METRVFQATSFLTLLYLTTSLHFRGGTIQWKPVNPFNGSVIIAYQVSWRRSSSYYCDNSTIANGTYLGEISLYCSVGCSGYVGDMLYRCTAFSESEDWSYGRNEYQFNATGISYFELQFASCCWLSTLQIGREGSWSLIMRGNLTVRKDTGRINSSPVVTMPPIVKAPWGCVSQIRLDVHDPDGDIIRCRWAALNQGECGDVCNAFPNSTLNSDTCMLTYYGGNSTTGQFVVAIQVEDFARSEDIIPFSSVPLQFIVNVVSPSNASIPCGYLPPIFIPPTPLNGTCIPVLYGQTWSGTLLAQNQYDLSSVNNIYVTGATPYVIMKNNTHLSIGIVWMATAGSSMQVICYNATENHGISSVAQCTTLLVMKNSSGIDINVLSDNEVKVNWTFTKPAPLGFNVSVYEVGDNATDVRVVKTNLMDSCSQSTQFSGLDGGTPYQVIIKGMNELNGVSESIVSSIYFLSQKVPIEPPYGIAKIDLLDHRILLTWSQPTLKNARGFVTGYSLIYSCVKNTSIELKLYEVSEERFYLLTVNDSAVTCSVAVCTRTIAGCGPLSEPFIVQEPSAAGLQSNSSTCDLLLQSQARTYLLVIYLLSSMVALSILVTIAISLLQCFVYKHVRRSENATSTNRRHSGIEMVECNASATRKEIGKEF